MVSFPFAFEDIQKRLEFLANDISVTTKVEMSVWCNSQLLFTNETFSPYKVQPFLEGVDVSLYLHDKASYIHFRIFKLKCRFISLEY